MYPGVERRVCHRATAMATCSPAASPAVPPKGAGTAIRVTIAQLRYFSAKLDISPTTPECSQ